MDEPTILHHHRLPDDIQLPTHRESVEAMAFGEMHADRYHRHVNRRRQPNRRSFHPLPDAERHLELDARGQASAIKTLPCFPRRNCVRLPPHALPSNPCTDILTYPQPLRLRSNVPLLQRQADALDRLHPRLHVHVDRVLRRDRVRHVCAVSARRAEVLHASQDGLVFLPNLE
jgi:hypothetical protein